MDQHGNASAQLADSRVDAWAALGLIFIVVATAIFWVAQH